MLEPRVAAVDKRRMAENDLLIDSLDPQNMLVLQTYAGRARAAKAANEEHDGWLDRLVSADDLDADQLTRIHGELIALGMLKFELANRQTGLRYCVSRRGIAALQNQVAEFTAETSSVPGDAQPAVETPGPYLLDDAA